MLYSTLHLMSVWNVLLYAVKFALKIVKFNDLFSFINATCFFIWLFLFLLSHEIEHLSWQICFLLLLPHKNFRMKTHHSPFEKLLLGFCLLFVYTFASSNPMSKSLIMTKKSFTIKTYILFKARASALSCDCIFFCVPNFQNILTYYT